MSEQGYELVPIDRGNGEFDVRRVPDGRSSFVARNGHLDAAAVALAGVSDAPSAIELLRDGSKAAGIRAIEEHVDKNYSGLADEVPFGLDIVFIDGLGFEEDYPRVESSDEEDSSWEGEL